MVMMSLPNCYDTVISKIKTVKLSKIGAHLKSQPYKYVA